MDFELNNIDARTLNEAFIEKVASIGDYVTDWIEDRIYEKSFSRPILEAKPVQMNELVESPITGDDTSFYKLVKMPPHARASVVDFKNEMTTAQWISARKVQVYFYDIKTELFQKSEKELKIGGEKISDIVYEKAGIVIQEKEDERFVQIIDAAASAHTTGGALGTGHVYSRARAGSGFNIDDMVNMRQMMDIPIPGLPRGYALEKILCARSTYEDILRLTHDSIGGIVEEHVRKGFVKRPTFQGIPFVITDKSDMVPHGVLYGFAARKRMGVMYFFEPTKFTFFVKHGIIEYQGQECLGMAIINDKSIIKYSITS